MSKSKKKIKIKHRKYSFYSKKKSKGRQALTVIIMIVVVIGLCVVGYGLGKPLMEYFSGNKTNPESTTSSTSSSVLPTVEADEPTAEPEPTVEAKPEPQPEKPEGAYTISVSAMKNAETLNNALASAKAQGYETVVLTLKTDGGQFLYKTENEWLAYATTNIVGTLTAKEIADAVKAQGMTAYAAVSTLKDPLTGDYAVSMRYNTADGYGWLDAAYDNGGKSWLSPFAEDTVKFTADITAELAAAGFERIILCDVMYPAFKDVDYNTYLSNMPELTNSASRLNALWNVVAACDAAAKSSGASVMLQVDSQDVFAAELLGTTAEAFGDKDKLASAEIVVNYTSESGSAYAAAKSYVGRMSSTYGSLKYSIRIDESISDADAENIAKAFSESGIEVFSE